MNLLTLLADDLLAWLHQKPDDVQRQVLLWLDPGREFVRLVPFLEPMLADRHAHLLRLAPEEERGQLALKLELLRAAAGEDMGSPLEIVVYLPGYDPGALSPTPDGSPPALWALYEFRYTGCVWGRGSKWEPGLLPKPLRLYEWLRAHGLEIAEDRGRTTRELTDGGPDSLLARYAEQHKGSTPQTWPRPLRADDVRDDLAGDSRDVLRGLFSAPANALRGWADPALVLAHLQEEFGLVAPQPLPTDATGSQDGAALADAFAVQIALTEAWDAFGQPDDFPYREHLPRQAEQRARQVRFVREELIPHTQLGPLFRERMARLESTYALAGWAAGHSGEPVALPLLAKQRWQAALSAFTATAAGGLAPARDWLAKQQTMLAECAAGPWDAAGIAHWSLLADLARLCGEAEAAQRALADGPAVAELVRRYTEQWWRLDATHLELRARTTAVPGLERLRQIADLALFAYTSMAADAFTTAIEAGGVWQSAELSSVNQLHEPLWRLNPNQRRAVIISDAFRWDLAQQTREHLARQGRSVTVQAVLSTLPSITPFGMTALLPLEQLPKEERILTFSYDAKPVIKDGAGRTLSTRDGRKALLETVLRGPKGSVGVAFADMDDILNGSVLPAVPLLVVFDRDIDQQGHKGGDQFPRLALDLAANVAQTIERLHEAGIAEVHVVTDHGFLLLPPGEVDALGRPAVQVSQAHRREARWAALKADAPVSEVVRLPCPLDPAGPVLGFPRGVRTLEAAESYEHGGISLQECVLPHLISQAPAAPARLEVTIRVTRDKLSGGTVPVVLAPVSAGTSLWSEARPVSVQLWVEVADGPASGRKIAGPITVEVRSESEELRPGLYLQEDIGMPLPAGQALKLRAIDSETGRDLATIQLTLQVDWE